MLWFLAALASWTHLLAWSLNIWRKDSKGIGEFWNAINEIRCLVISAYGSCIYEFWIYRPNIQLIYTISKTQTSFTQIFNKQYIFQYSHSLQPNLARSHDTSSNWWLTYIYIYLLDGGKPPNPQSSLRSIWKLFFPSIMFSWEERAKCMDESLDILKDIDASIFNHLSTM